SRNRGARARRSRPGCIPSGYRSIAENRNGFGSARSFVPSLGLVGSTLSRRVPIGERGNQGHGGEHGHHHGDRGRPSAPLPGKSGQEGTHAAADIERGHVE